MTARARAREDVDVGEGDHGSDSRMTMWFWCRRNPHVLPSEVDTDTHLSRNIQLNIPIVSSAMDTVTESRLAIAMAREGGVGIIHRVLPPADQAAEVDRVKKSESGMILDPVTISPDQTIRDAHELMAKYRISGIPVTKNGKLVGILTNRDLRFETRMDLKVSQVMKRDKLITAPEGTSLEKAREILHEHRIEKLPVVNKQCDLKGLITIKDIEKRIKYPNACKDAHGRLRVGAAVGVGAGDGRTGRACSKRPASTSSWLTRRTATRRRLLTPSK